MIKAYYNGKLCNTFKLLDIAKRADYEYVCKKLLGKHGFKITDFQKMEIQQNENRGDGSDVFLRAIAGLGYKLKSY